MCLIFAYNCFKEQLLRVVFVFKKKVIKKKKLELEISHLKCKMLHGKL